MKHTILCALSFKTITTVEKIKSTRSILEQLTKKEFL